MFEIGCLTFNVEASKIFAYGKCCNDFFGTGWRMLWHRRLLHSVQSSTFMGTESNSLSWVCRRITHLCVRNFIKQVN